MRRLERERSKLAARLRRNPPIPGQASGTSLPACRGMNLRLGGRCGSLPCFRVTCGPVQRARAGSTGFRRWRFSSKPYLGGFRRLAAVDHQSRKSATEYRQSAPAPTRLVCTPTPTRRQAVCGSFSTRSESIRWSMALASVVDLIISADTRTVTAEDSAGQADAVLRR